MSDRERQPEAGATDGDVPRAVRDAWDELGQVEPPALVDQAVRGRARAAIDRHRPSRPWSLGWAHGLATVGLVVLGLGLFLQLRDPARVGPTSPPNTIIRTLPQAEPDRFLEDVPAAGERAEADLQAAGSIGESAAPVAGKEDSSGQALRERQLRESAAAPPAAAGASVSRHKPPPKLEDEALVPETPERTAPLQPSGDPRRDPAAWLADIRALVAAGETRAARASLEAFREAWPDYPVPPELDP